MSEASKLTMKQQRFCEAFLRTGVGSEAYRAAYATKASAGVVANEASKLLALRHVKAEIERLQGEVAKDVQITLDECASNYRFAITQAKETGNLNALSTANAGLARLAGLDKQTFVEEKPKQDLEGLRKRRDEIDRESAQGDPHTVVKYLRNLAFLDPRLGRWADELARDPKFQSSGIFELKPRATSNGEALH